jgi:sugar phosphate isomerase/epimerase
MNGMNRRCFLQAVAASGAAAGLAGEKVYGAAPAAAEPAKGAATMKLGMVTYNMGKDMNCDELIELCQQTGLEGVELRATHKHRVEVQLDRKERAEVRKKFEDAGIAIAGLGSAFDYHDKDERKVKHSIRKSIEYAQLAADVGASGIKVRPNLLFDDEPVDVTCERIGKAWGEVAAAAADLGVEVRMEVHGGNGSSDPANILKMRQAADHPNALVCWNSNKGEQDENGDIRANFDLLKPYIGHVHITDIGVYQYPWQQLFDLLEGIHYTGWCLAEIQENEDAVRFMRYYRTLFDLYTGRYAYPNSAYSL